jgi:hypothetical protein
VSSTIRRRGARSRSRAAKHERQKRRGQERLLVREECTQERERRAPRAARHGLVHGEGDQRHREQGLRRGRPREELARRLGEERKRRDRGRAPRIECRARRAVGQHEQRGQQQGVDGGDDERRLEERSVEEGEVELPAERAPVPDRAHGPQPVQGALESQGVQVIVIVGRGNAQGAPRQATSRARRDAAPTTAAIQASGARPESCAWCLHPRVVRGGWA